MNWHEDFFLPGAFHSPPEVESRGFKTVPISRRPDRVRDTRLDQLRIGGMSEEQEVHILTFAEPTI